MIEPEQEFNPEYIPPIKKPLKIPIVILIVAILVITLLILTSPQKTPPIEIEPTAEPETYFPRQTSSLQLQTSALSSDAGVLETKADIEENIKYANTVDLSESNLNFPLLDFNINFEK